jgi:hypothetical protein
LQSFNHLVGGNEQIVGHGQAERLGSFQIDCQFEFRRLEHRQCWLAMRLTPRSTWDRYTPKVASRLTRPGEDLGDAKTFDEEPDGPTPAA